MKGLQRIAIVNQTIHWFIVGLMTPVLALLQLGKGLSLAQVGLNLALYAGAVVVLELPTGGLSDSIDANGCIWCLLLCRSSDSSWWRYPFIRSRSVWGSC